jgi:hypothetical protein
MLLLLNTAAAAGDIRNVIHALAASTDFAPICIPLEKTVTFWMSAGSPGSNFDRNQAPKVGVGLGGHPNPAINRHRKTSH